VWEVLAGKKAKTVGDVVAATGINQRTVYRVLKRMLVIGLTKKTGNLWARGPASLIEAAKKLGVAGLGERQKRQHLHERSQYRKALEKAQSPCK